MFEINKKQYVIKQSSGKILNIYYKENTGIWLSVLGKKNTWSGHSSVANGVLTDFSVSMDDRDGLHILCQDLTGNLQYLSYYNNGWDSRPLLKSKDPSLYNKHLGIIHSGQTTYFFYVLKHYGKNLLSFQYKKGTGNISDPRVIDYVTECIKPYCLLEDNNGDIYIFYRYFDSRYAQIGYRKLITVKEQWSEFQPITSYIGESSVISAAADGDNNIHAIWLKALPQKYSLVYSSKNTGTDKWNEETVLYTSTKPLYNSSITVIDNRLIAYWVKDSNIFRTISSDAGQSWSGPEDYRLFDDSHFSCISYLTNFAGELYNSYFNELPGNFNGGYKLAFLNEFERKQEKLNMDEIKKAVAEVMKVFTKDMEALKYNINEINKKTEEMVNDQRLMEDQISNFDERIEKINLAISKLKIELSEENKPLMPGAGFINITPGYLKGLNDK